MPVSMPVSIPISVSIVTISMRISTPITILIPPTLFINTLFPHQDHFPLLRLIAASTTTTPSPSRDSVIITIIIPIITSSFSNPSRQRMNTTITMTNFIQTTKITTDVPRRSCARTPHVSISKRHVRLSSALR